jgi:hypothetical protein
MNSRNVKKTDGCIVGMVMSTHVPRGVSNKKAVLLTME